VLSSPQLRKLSRVRPVKKLKKFGIPGISDLPGVGTNLQDHYEISVQGSIDSNFSFLDDCTLDASAADECLVRWQTPVLDDRGIYSSPGSAATMFYKSSTATNDDYDIFAFGGPVNFRRYFPGYSINATARHDVFT
jgi:choline dehydrogenase